MTILLWCLSGCCLWFLLRLSLKISENPTVQLVTLLLCHRNVVNLLLGLFRHFWQLEVLLEVLIDRNLIIFGLGFGGLYLTRCRSTFSKYWNFHSYISWVISTQGHRVGVVVPTGTIFGNWTFFIFLCDLSSWCVNTFRWLHEIKLRCIGYSQLWLWVSLRVNTINTWH
jgi:hypothetical protein